MHSLICICFGGSGKRAKHEIMRSLGRGFALYQSKSHGISAQKDIHIKARKIYANSVFALDVVYISFIVISRSLM